MLVVNQRHPTLLDLAEAGGMDALAFAGEADPSWR